MAANLSPEENARRYNLYRQGYTDTQIAKILGCKPAAITKWRNIRYLPPNVLPVNFARKHRYGSDDWEFEVGEKVKIVMRNSYGKGTIKGYGIIISAYRRFIVVQLPKYRVTIHQWELKEGKAVIEKLGEKVG
jgi:hypothetical protein